MTRVGTERGGGVPWAVLEASRAVWADVVEIRPADDPRTEDWIRLDDPESIEPAVVARGKWLHVDDLRIVASNFFKAYAQALLVPSIATLTIGGVVPDLSASNARLAIAYPRSRVLSLGRSMPDRANAAPGRTDQADRSTAAPAAMAVDALIAGALDGHLMPLIDGIRGSYHISERVLRTSISYELVAAARRLGADEAHRDLALALTARVLSAAGDRLSDTGSMVVEVDAPRQVRFERATCCLKHRIPGKEHCVGCSLLRLRAS